MRTVVGHFLRDRLHIKNIPVNSPQARMFGEMEFLIAGISIRENRLSIVNQEPISRQPCN
jgi:hypothetical protein